MTSFGFRKEAEGKGAVDGAAAEGTDIVEGLKDLVFGSDEADAASAAAGGAAGAVGGPLGQVITGFTGLTQSARSHKYGFKFTESYLG